MTIPPCERPVTRASEHPRYPSGWCIAWNERGDFYQVYFDSNVTRGSKRKFASVQDAVALIRERRIRKGFSLQ